MFHTALTEFQPSDLERIDSNPLSLLPKNFDYYAGGHVHYVFEKDEKGYGTIVYPGPTFPNSFSELEKLGHGSFYIYEGGKLEFIPLESVKTFHIKHNCKHKTIEQINSELIE